MERKEMNIKLAYLAGYVDGEGCISFCIPNRKTKPTTVPCLQLAMSTGDRAVLRLFAKTFGTSVRPGHNYRKQNRKQKRKLWRVSLYGAKAQIALRQLLPYLVIKHRIASEVIKIQFRTRGGHKANPLTRKERNQRIRISRLVSKFNQRVTV